MKLKKLRWNEKRPRSALGVRGQARQSAAPTMQPPGAADARPEPRLAHWSDSEWECRVLEQISQYAAIH